MQLILQLNGSLKIELQQLMKLGKGNGCVVGGGGRRLLSGLQMTLCTADELTGT